MNSEQRRIMSYIQTIWNDPQYHGLRFLQLIGNCFGPVSTGDIYFVSDDQMIKYLRTMYGDHVALEVEYFLSDDLEHDGKREEDQLQDFEERHGDQSRLPRDG